MPRILPSEVIRVIVLLPLSTVDSLAFDFFTKEELEGTDSTFGLEVSSISNREITGDAC